jgi:HEAT repeat protein
MRDFCSGAYTFLINTLRDVESGVREAAARAFGTVGRAAAEAVPVLASTLCDVEPDVRRAAVEALGQIGPTAAETVIALRGCLRHDCGEDIAQAAAGALARINSMVI